MRGIEFDASAFEDLAWWIERDRAQALRIVRLMRDVQREPFAGIGKPEPLKHELAGCWSRRIDQEHRLVYQVLPEKSELSLAAFTTEDPAQASAWNRGLIQSESALFDARRQASHRAPGSVDGTHASTAQTRDRPRSDVDPTGLDLPCRT